MSSIEQHFQQTLYDQFGLNKAESAIILKLNTGINGEYSDSQEAGQLLMRLLGGIVYDEADFEFSLNPVKLWEEIKDIFSKKYRWDAAAGWMHQDQALKESILSKEEILLLGYALKTQHRYAAGKYLKYIQEGNGFPRNFFLKEYKTYQSYGNQVTEAEFEAILTDDIRRFSNTGDFVHQCITTATNLVNKFMLADLIGIVKFRSDPGQYRKHLSGWLGDLGITLGPLTLIGPGLGTSDYLANLDAVNIAERMQATDLTILEAFTAYYTELSAGDINRAEEFKQHLSYAEVEKNALREYHADDVSELEAINSEAFNFLKTIKGNHNYLL